MDINNPLFPFITHFCGLLQTKEGKGTPLKTHAQY
jgi:hypothetical protein